jgi:hypothetical protein
VRLALKVISWALWALLTLAYAGWMILGAVEGSLGCEDPVGSSNYGQAGWRVVATRQNVHLRERRAHRGQSACPRLRACRSPRSSQRGDPSRAHHLAWRERLRLCQGYRAAHACALAKLRQPRGRR